MKFKTGETSEHQSSNPNDPEARFDGTTQGAKSYASKTPGQSKRDVVKKVIKDKVKSNG